MNVFCLEQHVPAACLDEMLLFLSLSPLLVADLEREFCPIIATCDASPSFGFGVSVHTCPTALVEKLATHSERHGDYLRMTLEPGDVNEKPRLGNPVRLPFSQSSFTDVLSIKAKHITHSGAMEAHGLLFLSSGM